MHFRLLIRTALFTLLICVLLQLYVNANEYSASDFQDATTQSFDEQSAKSKADKAAQALNPTNIFESFLNSINESLNTSMSSFMSMFAVIIISGIFCSISDSFGAENLFEFISVLFLILLTLKPIGSCIDYIFDSSKKLCMFMTSFIPTMTSIYVSGGSNLAGASSAVICSGAISVLQVLSYNLMIPGVKLCVCFTAISALCKNINLTSVSNFIKTTCMWISGLTMTLFCGILSLQTVLQTGADSLALKGAKFTAARLIPVAGGMISESLKTVLTGVSFVRGVTGALGVAFIVYSVLPPIAAVVVFKLIFCVCSMCCKLTSSSNMAAYFDGINMSLSLLLSVLLCCSVSFIIVCAIFMKTAVSV